jgi:hypothetical protein
MLVRGSVDVVTGTEVGGWAYAPGQQDPVLVQVVLNHEILGEAVANIHRPDLAAAGLGDGRCGYTVKLYREISPPYLPFLTVKLDGGDAELPRGSAAGFCEFFTALYRAHPMSGRPRSVLGGLWTDRTDAAAVLRGKCAVGLLPPEVAGPIAQLIHAGLAIMELRNPSTESLSKITPKWVGAVLDDPVLLPLLRGVLEDNPLVVSAGVVRDAETELAQPSAGNPSPSPAECLAVVVALKEGVVLDVVRDSHELPEFSPAGTSRWADGAGRDGFAMAAAHGVLDRHALQVGSAAAIGPGVMYRLRCEANAEAVQMLCVPARLMPVALAAEKARRETVRASGVRVFL